MTERRFRIPGPIFPPPEKPPRFPNKPPANSPPYRRSRPSKAVAAAIAAAEAREGDAA